MSVCEHVPVPAITQQRIEIERKIMAKILG